MTGRPVGAVTVVAVRLLVGLALAWRVIVAMLAPETALLADLATVLVIALTAWRPVGGLAAVVALAPAGLMLASAPARAAEVLAWAFVSTWLLAAWRPLGRVPRRLLVPAVLYAGCALVSWLGQTLRGAGGVEATALPLFLVRSLMPGHLMFSAQEPETLICLQMAAGLAILLASACVTGRETSARRTMAFAIVGSASVLSLATAADIARQWSENGFGGWFLLRYVRGERFALHLPDLNAAGSLYVLAVLVAIALALANARRRTIWVAGAAVMLPALWLTGSRSAALGGLIVGAVLIAAARYRASIRITRPMAAVGVVLAVAAGGAAIASVQQPAEQGSATQSVRMRTQFLVTSARMLASAPVLGVGIGRYHERSSEFMPPALRAVYPHENAHNYFAQQFAELGIVGGLLFMWLIGAGLVQGWRALRERQLEAALLALFAGAAGYLLTCVTGHPLLVPEAALPFWAIFGAVAAGENAIAGKRVATAVAWVVVAILAVALVLGVRAYLRPAGQPAERGFYGLETSSDGRPFVWMTRHGIWHIGPQPGHVTIPLRAPDQPARSRAWAVDVEIGGRHVGRYTLETGRWTTITIPLRDHSARPFRRVDLWANQLWTRQRDLGVAGDEGPRSVMVGEVRWEAAGGR